MELKPDGEAARHRLNSVLIVPLWNWNICCRRLSEKRNSFNRTFMELKLMNKALWVSEDLCFNRTFMELKQAYVLSKMEEYAF